MHRSQHILIILSSIFLLVFSLSCRKSPKCWGEDRRSGSIEGQPDIVCEPKTENETFVFDSDTAYTNGFKSMIGAFPCRLPSIDFNKHTLLGLKTESTGCRDKFIRSVSKDEKNKVYLYRVVVKECGDCKPLVINYNWVLVPKLPAGWDVTFESVIK